MIALLCMCILFNESQQVFAETNIAHQCLARQSQATFVFNWYGPILSLKDYYN